ncbi:hypothetical protein ANCDUO_10023 [Ancylostoma duodenale]|uniref:Uncharacterized protein n=1 Tax=Ancylostoma duodenale TaxID=51022 RepID=A0A0C2GRZ0_9BILA|nr:hypothetical protein ANCDUO_10023 [Ancylostoma duodenale]
MFHDNFLNGVDATKIIGPFMSPFMDMFDVMQGNAKARAYADKVVRERDESPLSTSRSIFEMFERLQRPTTTTTPQPPLIERLIRPYLEPWQKQINEFGKDMGGFMPTTTTPSPTIATTQKENIFEKSMKLFFPSFQEEVTTTTTTTTAAPKLFDASMFEKFEKLFFPRLKRDVHRRKKREPSIQPLPNPDLLNPFRELEKPILELANPFKPNPLMSLFTTPLPLAELPPIEKPKLLDMPIPTATLPAPQYKLQDPFYNPLYPNRKSKLFDMLAGGEAVRLLG